MKIESEVRAYIATNLLFSENGFTHGDDASFLQEGIIDSLGVMELVTFVTRQFGIEVSPQEVTPENFDSIRKLAAFIRRKQEQAVPAVHGDEAILPPPSSYKTNGEDEAVTWHNRLEKLSAQRSVPARPCSIHMEGQIVEIQGDGTRAPLFFLHGDLYGGGLYCFNLAQQLGSDQPFYALPPLKLEGQEIPSVEEIAGEHLRALRACQSRGPYVLGGFCVAASIAFEMAQRLRAEGEVVEHLLLVDPQLPSFLNWVRTAIELVPGLRHKEIDARLAVFSAVHKRLYRLSELWSASLAENLRFISRRKSNAAQTRPSQNRSIAGRDPAVAYPWTAARYRPARYDGRTALFCCDSVLMSAKQKIRAWEKLIPHAIMHVMPGEHIDLVTDNAERLAGDLRAVLHQVQPAAASKVPAGDNSDPGRPPALQPIWHRRAATS